jgi:two-component system, OmpR family, response regulator
VALATLLVPLVNPAEGDRGRTDLLLDIVLLGGGFGRVCSEGRGPILCELPFEIMKEPAPIGWGECPGKDGGMRVLVAEDDTGLRSVLQRGLSEHGYIVDAVPDGEVALRFLRSYEYDAVVLDWRMPKISGVEVVAELRRRGSHVPTLMLTARDTTADRIAGLDQGADDYLVKPFDFGELLARLRALQRRPPVLQAPVLTIGDVEFDPATRQVRIGSSDPKLTSTEVAILEILMRRTPAVVTRSAIALHAWSEEASALGSNTIDVHMARLRAKLRSKRVRIETVRGTGFRIVAT